MWCCVWLAAWVLGGSCAQVCPASSWTTYANQDAPTLFNVSVSYTASVAACKSLTYCNATVNTTGSVGTAHTTDEATTGVVATYPPVHLLLPRACSVGFSYNATSGLCVTKYEWSTNQLVANKTNMTTGFCSGGACCLAWDPNCAGICTFSNGCSTCGNGCELTASDHCDCSVVFPCASSRSCVSATYA